MDWMDRTHQGDCIATMRKLVRAGARAQMCVTSPPYWGLRDYGGGQKMIGLEPTLNQWVRKMVHVMRWVRSMLADDGTLWLNLGDSIASDGGSGFQGKHGDRYDRTHTQRSLMTNSSKASGLKPKDLMGQPWRVALALQRDGWWLRSAIIWNKPNAMPESTKDRPTRSYEHIFLLSKSETYYYDWKAISEEVSENTKPRSAQKKPVSGWVSGAGVPHDSVSHNAARKVGGRKFDPGTKSNESFSEAVSGLVDRRNARDVWTFPTEANSFAHFAAYPLELAQRCILAGSRHGDVVLDPFHGSGTTGQAALGLGRHYVGCELVPEYIAIEKRHRQMNYGLQL